MKLCDKITKLRKRKGYTQEELASIMEVSRQSVFKWESGENTPDLEKIKKLTKVFNVSFDELLDDTKEIGEVSGVTPRQGKGLSLILSFASVAVIALCTVCYIVGRATGKSEQTSSNPQSSLPAIESQSSSEQSSIEPTSEELTKTLTIQDLLGRWQTARYIWNIQDYNGNIMLVSIYDKVDTTTNVHEPTDEYSKTSYFSGYNATTGLMEGMIYHYTGSIDGEWYPITVKRDKTGIHIYWKNLTFEAF